MLEASELQRLAAWVRGLTTEQLASTLAMCEAERDRRRSELGAARRESAGSASPSVAP